MYFIRRKKHERDQKAGLIFHWRGFRKHHVGKIIALLLACVFFGFSVYAIKLEVIKAPLLSKKQAVVIMLNEDDPYCQALMLQVEEQSPFPARWDPISDKEVLLRLNEEKDLLQGKLWDYKMGLEPLPEDKSSVELASIINSYDALREGPKSQWRQAGIAGGVIVRSDLLIRARVHVTGDLKSRISSVQLALPPDLIADEDFGQTFRFQLGLDKAGFVNTCIPLPGGSTDVTKITVREKKIAAWLRTLRFSSTEQATAGWATGQLELQIEANRQ